MLVPDYNTNEGKHIFLGSQNRKIKEILNANGLEKCDVKAIIFKQLKEEHPPEEMLENMPDRNTEKNANIYFYQDFKIACPNIEYSIIIDFLRNVNYKGYVWVLFKRC